ncbi:terpene synthase family protein [Chitinophaga nivalis]|uniref:Terpene synthase n=1 Tax=Chitinophaga nivalis TaxID=2991709 RepID=A0ABT3IPZ7_9BACT|nr:terpene synthase family protein [Chitinophaga nivalis]MCW3464434.1 terpene synthase family protein [Chitinophaga nivalis]MCW3485875.1 terpene synthase family protein [Chitinophaga nivalis]
MKHNVQLASHARMQIIQKEYAALMSNGVTSFSLLELFNHGQFNLDEFCQSFRPHPYARQLKRLAQEFGEKYEIWLENAEHYITCAIYLFPTANLYRMNNILKNCAIDFYLNDTMGREVFCHLSPGEQVAANEIRERMGKLTAPFGTIAAAHPVEVSNAEMMQDIYNTSPQKWFDAFCHMYNYHIEVTHLDCNTNALGRVPSIDEYIDMRGHISGMHHTIQLIEYSDGQFLDWDWLESAGILADMKRLQYVTAAIGCLMNDLFSFEKEVIDNGSDSNLLMILALNDPALSLETVIRQSATIVRNLLLEFTTLVNQVRTRGYQQLPTHSEAVDKLDAHIGGLERCVQASWMWQVYTKRYKRHHSIWKETQLTPVIAAAI